MTNPSFDGLRVLVVEDESLIAMSIEDTLTELGCEVVGTAPTVEAAVAAITALSPHAAILDVNLGGKQSFPVAQCLRQKGVPFVFSTGYGSSGLPDTFNDVPVLTKPFQRKGLEAALAKAIALLPPR